MNRRKFILLSSLTGVGCLFPEHLLSSLKPLDNGAFIMTVTGKISLDKIGVCLPHEHIVTDFTGAEKVVQPQYQQTDAFKTLLPHLKMLKQNGVDTLTECTPAYIGRDVKLLRQLSSATGLKIITNTGYYAAVDLKYLPSHAHKESIDELAARWINEWEHGIDGTSIRPGFIKLGVGSGPLKPIEIKLIKAAAQTHLKSGLKIAIHTGNAQAAIEEVEILKEAGVHARALIWVHAQNDDTGTYHIELAKKGCWISLDGVSETNSSISKYCSYLKNLKAAGLLHQVLVSHDDGFAVISNTEKITFETFQNGNSHPYRSFFTKLRPALLKAGLTKDDLYQITVKNPQNAFKIEICHQS